MLEVKHLTRRYGGFKAVEDVSFSIAKGEIVGLLGHNGAGKTTIMRMISGFLEPDRGAVFVDGTDLAKEKKKVQRDLGYLPENLPIYPEMTVADYLDYAADLKGLENNDKKSEIRQAVAATDLSAKLLERISTLSRGYKQRVGVAQAILGEPRLLILDEPTSGLDPEQTRQMRKLIRDIARNATVILSTHIMQEVNALCSRVLMLRTGRLEVDSRLDELRHSNHLLIETTLPVETMQGLQYLAGVSSIRPIPPTGNRSGENDTAARLRYRIELDAQADERAASADLAKAIVNLEHALFSLHPEQRDLETLFKDVNEGNPRGDPE